MKRKTLLVPIHRHDACRRLRLRLRLAVAVVATAIATVVGGATGTTKNAYAQEDDRLTLPAALAAAQTRSPDVQEARARTEVAEAEADHAMSGYLPSIAAHASGNGSYDPGLVDANGGALGAWTTSAEVGGTFRWTPFDFGRTPHTVGAARANARAAAWRSKGAANDIARAVATTFLTAAFDELLTENAKATVRIRERHAALIRGLVIAGLRPNVEEARARVELELSKLEATTAERQLAQDHIRLATFLRLPPTKRFTLVRPSVLPTITDAPGDAITRAVTSRPETRAATNEVEAQEELLAAASAARLPSFGLTFDGRYRGVRREPETLFAPSGSMTGQATLSIPIFDWEIWGRVPVVRHQVAAAEAQRDKVAAQVRAEAADAVYGVQAARLLVAEAKSARDLSGATLAVTEGRYQTGLATPTDLFDAAARDAEARRATIRAELSLAVATVQVLASTGRLSELR